MLDGAFLSQLASFWEYLNISNEYDMVHIPLDQFIPLKPMVFLGIRTFPPFLESPVLWCTPDLAHLLIISEPGLVDLTPSTTFGQVFPLQDPSQGLQALMDLTWLDRKKKKKHTFGPTERLMIWSNTSLNGEKTRKDRTKSFVGFYRLRRSTKIGGQVIYSPYSHRNYALSIPLCPPEKQPKSWNSGLRPRHLSFLDKSISYCLYLHSILFINSFLIFPNSNYSHLYPLWIQVPS